MKTIYGGVEFRSEAVARHAVLMDLLGIEWKYLGREFQDFWLPELVCWLVVVDSRIKSFVNEEKEMWIRCLAFGGNSKHDIYMLYDDFDPPSVIGNYDDLLGHKGMKFTAGKRDDFSDGCCYFAECRECGSVGLGWLGGICPEHYEIESSIDDSKMTPNFRGDAFYQGRIYMPRIIKAYAAAKNFDFTKQTSEKVQRLNWYCATMMWEPGTKSVVGNYESRPTFTYFIAAPSLGKVKIGKSKNPTSRLKTFTTGMPVKLTMLGYVSECQFSEIDMHEKFDHLREDGEWFKLTDELLTFIREICEGKDS